MSVTILYAPLHVSDGRNAYFFKIDHTIGEKTCTSKIWEKKPGFRHFFLKHQKTDVFLTFWGNWGSDDAKIGPKETLR